MQNSHESTQTSFDAIRIEFMDVCYELHQQESEMNKKTKTRKRFETRRAIENHQEQKRLKELLKDCWDDV